MSKSLTLTIDEFHNLEFVSIEMCHAVLNLMCHQIPEIQALAEKYDNELCFNDIEENLEDLYHRIRLELTVVNKGRVDVKIKINPTET